MTSVTVPSLAPSAPLPPRALVRLCGRAQRGLLGIRLGRVYALGVGVSQAVVVFIGPASLPSSTGLWTRALAIASWVAGFGALSLSTELTTREAAHGLTALARLRGFGEQPLERARLMAGALRLTATTMTPGLLVALATLLRHRTLSGSLVALGLALATLPYAALVGTSLATLARACSRWLPGRGRLLLLALVLGPWLLSSGLGISLPSLPSAFAWLLQHLSRSFR